MGLRRTVARLLGREWDDYTGSYVRAGWVAERQSVMAEEYRRWQSGETTGGTCLRCGQPTYDHPMPERMLRSGPDLCARVKRSSGKESVS